jgi:hypothetical protein
MSVQNRAGFERFLDEVDRLLHNVLAAVASLREHTRRAKRKYLCSDELGAEYDARVADVFLAPKAQFVQRLRVMVAHRNLPRLLGYTSVILDESFTSNIVLDRDELLEWDDWGVTAQAFLEGSEEPIALDEVIVEYRSGVVGSHEWFTHALTEKNREALKEYERGSEDLLAFTKTLWGPTPR